MAWNKLPKHFRQPHASMDAIDREAESQGNSISTFRREHEINKPQGRRLLKNENKESRGAAIIASKRVVNLTKDHQVALDRYVRAA